MLPRQNNNVKKIPLKSSRHTANFQKNSKILAPNVNILNNQPDVNIHIQNNNNFSMGYPQECSMELNLPPEMGRNYQTSNGIEMGGSFQNAFSNQNKSPNLTNSNSMSNTNKFEGFNKNLSSSVSVHANQNVQNLQNNLNNALDNVRAHDRKKERDRTKPKTSQDGRIQSKSAQSTQASQSSNTLIYQNNQIQRREASFDENLAPGNIKTGQSQPMKRTYNQFGYKGSKIKKTTHTQNKNQNHAQQLKRMNTFTGDDNYIVNNGNELNTHDLRNLNNINRSDVQTNTQIYGESRNCSNGSLKDKTVIQKSLNSYMEDKTNTNLNMINSMSTTNSMNSTNRCTHPNMEMQMSMNSIPLNPNPINNNNHMNGNSHMQPPSYNLNENTNLNNTNGTNMGNIHAYCPNNNNNNNYTDIKNNANSNYMNNMNNLNNIHNMNGNVNNLNNLNNELSKPIPSLNSTDCNGVNSMSVNVVAGSTMIGENNRDMSSSMELENALHMPPPPHAQTVDNQWAQK
jgi:hypothetical protein